MWQQRPLHVAFTAQEPVAYQPQGLIGLKSASLPQHEMLTDVGESGQNAKNAYHPIATGERASRGWRPRCQQARPRPVQMLTGNARHARPAGSIDEWVLQSVVACF
jgi:hypothetical protein